MRGAGMPSPSVSSGSSVTPFVSSGRSSTVTNQSNERPTSRADAARGSRGPTSRRAAGARARSCGPKPGIRSHLAPRGKPRAGSRLVELERADRLAGRARASSRGRRRRRRGPTAAGCSISRLPDEARGVGEARPGSAVDAESSSSRGVPTPFAASTTTDGLLEVLGARAVDVDGPARPPARVEHDLADAGAGDEARAVAERVGPVGEVRRGLRAVRAAALAGAAPRALRAGGRRAATRSRSCRATSASRAGSFPPRPCGPTLPIGCGGSGGGAPGG